MSERKIHEARSVRLDRCDHCRGLHLVVDVNDRSQVIAALDAADWAALFMQDDEFAKAAAARLGRH